MMAEFIDYQQVECEINNMQSLDKIDLKYIKSVLPRISTLPKESITPDIERVNAKLTFLLIKKAVSTALDIMDPFKNDITGTNYSTAYLDVIVQQEIERMFE